MTTEMQTLGRRSFVIGAAAVAAAAVVNPLAAVADPTSAELMAQADAKAAEAAQQQAQADALGAQAAEHQAQADAVLAQVTERQAEAETALASLNNMQINLDIASANYTQALMDLEAAQGRMAEALQRIEELTSQIAYYQDHLGTRARGMYRSGGNSFLDVLLGSSSFEEFASNWDVLNTMNKSDAAMVRSTKRAREEMDEQRLEYAEQEKVAEEKTAEAARIEAEAAATVEQMRELYNSLSDEVALLIEQQRAVQSAADAARAEQVVAASAAAASAEEGERARRAAEEAARAEEEERREAERRAAEAAAQAQREAAAAAAAAAAQQQAAAVSAGSTAPAASVTSAPAAEPAYSQEGGTDAVSRAYSCLGLPYAWGAVGPGSYDCSGLVSYCLTGSHTRLGTTYTFMGWPQVSNPQPGDVCTSSSHCGIYIGGGQMIHASTYGVGVIVGPVQSDMIIVRW